MSNSKQGTVVLRSQQPPLPPDLFMFVHSLSQVLISQLPCGHRVTLRSTYVGNRERCQEQIRVSASISVTLKKGENTVFLFPYFFSLLANKINGFLVVFFLKENRTLCDGKAVLQAGPNQKTKRELETAKKYMWCIMGPICLY